VTPRECLDDDADDCAAFNIFQQKNWVVYDVKVIQVNKKGKALLEKKIMRFIFHSPIKMIWYFFPPTFISLFWWQKDGMVKNLKLSYENSLKRGTIKAWI
jgi:hypothetical protein